MNCKNCGNDITKKTVICPGCGCKIKKSIYKKWWFWVIIAVVFIALVSPSDSGETTDDAASSSVGVEQSSTTIQSEKVTTTKKTTQGETEAQYKKSCKAIDFKTLSRNPDKYKGERYALSGQIIQVQEPTFGNTVTLRVNITKETYEYLEGAYYTDTILATVKIPDGADRLLEDDVIKFWGECAGSYTYTSVMGSSVTLPKIEIKYFELAN